MPRIVIPLVLVGALSGLPRTLGALQARDARAVEVTTAIEAGDEQHRLLRPNDALETFEAVIADDPHHYEALWRAAREAINLGMLALEDGDRDTMYERAERFARAAVASAPRGAAGHHWLAVALGRRALDEGSRTKVALGEEIHAEAVTVLALDSLSAGGHHVLGQWHAEVRRLRGFTRFLARRLLGGDTLDEASWEDAVFHLERAVELEPDGLIHRTALARVYLDLERFEDASVQLTEALERPSSEPTDALHKQEAQELLEKLP